MSTLLAAGHVLIGARVGPALAGMAKVNSTFAATATRAGRTGKLLTKGLTAPIAIGFGYAIKQAADFESALNNMQAVSGATAATMKQVSKTAKQLGADTELPGTSAKDAADAMTELAKGGLTAKEAMEAARGTLLLSAAAGIDNARAAEIQADALNGFALGAKDAGRVADLLAAAANASTAEIDDMSMSLSQSAAVAHQAGIPIEDTVTALSRLANAGIKSSDAGTSLKTMLLRLMAPMGAGKKAVEKLNLELRDQHGALKSLPALADEFQAKTQGMTKAQRDAAFAAIFGTDAIRAANILLGEGSAAHEKMKRKVTEQGAAQELAAAKMKGFNGSLEAFKSSAETAAITIGTILLPYATKLANGLTGLVSGFETLPSGVQKGVVALLAVAAVVGPLILLAAKLTIALKTLGPVFAASTGPVGLFAAAVGLAIGGIFALNAAFGSGTSQLQRYREAMDAAKGALDRLKNAALGVEQADLAHKQAVLEVKAAQQGLRQVQAQVNSGQLKGRDAALALEQAQLRVKQAQLNVRQSSQQVTQATRQEAAERRASVQELLKAVKAGEARVAAAKKEVALSNSSAAAVAKLRTAERDLAAAKAALAKNSDVLNSRLQAGARQIPNFASALTRARAKVGAASQSVTNLTAKLTSFASSAAPAASSQAYAVGSAMGDGLVMGIVSRTGAVVAAAARLAALAASAMAAAAQVRSPSRLTMKIGEDIAKGLEVGIKNRVAGMKRSVMRAVREALVSARSSAMSMASGIASSVSSAIDEMTGRRTAALGNSPEAQRIRAIEAQQRQTQAARERADLQAAIAEAETYDERQRAIEDFNSWQLDQERQALQDQLDAKEAAYQQEADARKTAVERGLNDIVDGLNRGVISQKDAINQINALLAANAPEMANLGDLMGTSFANGFSDALSDLFKQIGAIAAVGDVGAGFGSEITRPFSVAMNQWQNRRRTLVKQLQDAKEKARGKDSPGGTSITSTEAALIKSRQKTLDAWDAARPQPAAMGGIIRGPGRSDSVPLLAAPGEGVLDHRNMDRLMDMAHGSAGGGRGGDVYINVQVQGSLIGTGGKRELARELAELVQPQINRRISIAA